MKRTLRAMRLVGLLVAGAVAVVGAVGATAGVALADPKSEDVITLTCPGQEPVQIVSAGGGPFTPGFDLSSTTVYQPVGFADQFFVVRDGEGVVIEEGFEPGLNMKNGTRKGQTIIECSFLSTFSGEDPELGYIEGEFGGTVFVVQR